MSKKVLIETYGCQMNEADTELMHGLLRKRGYELTQSQAEADVVLLNTCAVRERAEERIFGRLGWLKDLKRQNPDLVLGVTGCMAERMREKLVERTPYVDLVVGPDAYRRLPELVDELTQRGDAAEISPEAQLALESESPKPQRKKSKKSKKSQALIDVRLEVEEHIGASDRTDLGCPVQRRAPVDLVLADHESFLEELAQALRLVVEDALVHHRVVVVLHVAHLFPIACAAPVNAVAIRVVRRRRGRVSCLGSFFRLRRTALLSRLLAPLRLGL